MNYTYNDYLKFQRPEAVAVPSVPTLKKSVGILGSRAVVIFNDHVYSPIYGHFEWKRGRLQAHCAIGCTEIPNDRHLGCGIHAHFAVGETMTFVEQIRGAADAITLVEATGHVALHEKGFRTEYAEIIAVVDWSFRDTDGRIDWYFSQAKHLHPCVRVASILNVPLITPSEAQHLIDRSLPQDVKSTTPQR